MPSVPITPPLSPLLGDPLLSLPNLLSLSRVGLAVALWPALVVPVPGGRVLWLLGLTAAAGVTDVLDGWLARRRRGGRPPEPGAIGPWLDPLCDKIFVLALIGAVYLLRRPPLYQALMLLVRELLQVPMILFYFVRGLPVMPQRLRRFRFDFRANVLGKATTVTQFVALLWLLLGLPGALALAVTAASVAAAAIASYVVRGVRMLPAPQQPAT